MMKSLQIKRWSLWCSQTLFLWMFFSSSPLEHMADANVFQVPAAVGIRATVYEYAAEWRHGLVGFWPVYVPGFFATAISVWLWAIGRPLKRLLPELLLVTGVAAASALLLAPAGTRLALQDLHQDLGIGSITDGFSVSVQDLVLGLFSLAAWNAFILACQRALWWRSFWPLLVPAALDLLLFLIRPNTFDDLVFTWLERSWNGEWRAILWLVAIPGISACLVAIHLRWEKRERSVGRLPKALQRISCLLFGHKVDNCELRSSDGGARCRCGSKYLWTDGRYTRVGHTLRCFLGGHIYHFAGNRDCHNEYVCIRCGHPLVLTRESDPQPRQETFRKGVHYPCGVLAHRVHPVAERDGAVEYACFCGHSFLREARGERSIRHPFVCVFLGHFIRFSCRRFGFTEFVCRNCGHPFSFYLPTPVRVADEAGEAATLPG